jgi:hypothetical protein
MLLAPAIAFLAVDGLKRGFAPYEKTLLALLWLVPLIARTVAQASMVPLAVPAMIALFAMIMSRIAIRDNESLPLARNAP